MSVDLMHMWGTMGLFAKGIVILMLMMSVFSLTVAFQKLMLIRKSQAATRKFAPEFSRAIQEGSLENAIRLAEKNKVKLDGQSLKPGVPYPLKLGAKILLGECLIRFEVTQESDFKVQTAAVS